MEVIKSKKGIKTKRIGKEKGGKNIALKVFSPSKTIVGAAALMMVAVLMTKFFGFLRLALMGSNIDHTELSLFNAANTIPEVIFNIIALGSINAALIPILTKSHSNEDQSSVNRTISSVLNLGALIFIACSVLVFIFSDVVAHLFINGDNSKNFNPNDISKVSDMIKILIFSPIILALSSTLASLLQIQRKFFITQLSPLFYNIGIIISIYTIVPWMNGDPRGLCLGVILGSILHLLCELPGFKGTKYKFKAGYINLKDSYLRSIGKLMIPRSMGLAAEQAAFIVQTRIALSLYPDSLTIYKFALSLRDIPISFFGMTLAQAVFPSLSEDANKENLNEFNSKLKYTFQQILFLVIPSTIIFIILKLPIVRVTYGIFGGQITFDTVNQISWVLLFISFTIVFQAVLNLLVRAYYALSDTKTPFIISIIVIVLEIALSVIFVHFFTDIVRDNVGAVAGLALASSVASALGVLVLTQLLNKRTKFIDKNFFISILKKLVSGVIMTVAILGSYRFLELFIDSSLTIGLIIVLIISVSIGLCTYLASEYNLNDDDMRLSAKFFKGLKSALKVFIKNKKTSSDVGNQVSNVS